MGEIVTCSVKDFVVAACQCFDSAGELALILVCPVLIIQTRSFMFNALMWIPL